MPDERIERVRSCAECRHYCSLPNTWGCEKIERDFKKGFDINTIPSWCPLELVPPKDWREQLHELHLEIDRLKEELKKEHDRAEYNAQCAAKNAQQRMKNAGLIRRA